MKILSKLSMAAAAALMTTAVFAANPEVGGAAMFETKNIVENAVNSADHTTLVAAVKAAGLVDTLQSDGPFTVFAPVNAAFEALPAGTVDTLLKPENKAMLTKILTAHVVSGNWSSAEIMKLPRTVLSISKLFPAMPCRLKFAAVKSIFLTKAAMLPKSRLLT